MQNAKVLVAHLAGAQCEIIKNIVLTGVNISIFDNIFEKNNNKSFGAIVSENDLKYNFFLERADLGFNVSIILFECYL